MRANGLRQRVRIDGLAEDERRLKHLQIAAGQ